MDRQMTGNGWLNCCMLVVCKIGWDSYTYDTILYTLERLY